MRATALAIEYNRNNDVYCSLENHFNFAEKFLKFVDSCSDVNLDRERLKCFTEADINELIQNGLLATHRVAGNFLLSIPNAGAFVKEYLKSRKALLRMIKATKFDEIMRAELETKSLPRGSKMGMKYLILDLIGSDTVQW
jgi:hypothetical protein